MTKVAIFEDNKHLRETIQLLLNNTPGYQCAGAYPDCNNVLADVAGSDCDVILMDIEMPGMSGIEATKLVKENFPSVPILIQTVFFEDEYIFNAICAGASGYILKTTTPQGYMEAIADVQSGGSPMTPGIAKRVLELFRSGLAPVAPSKDYHLTQQEKKYCSYWWMGKATS